MADIDFYTAKPGDICNEDGDIRGGDTGLGAQIISAGVIRVTPEQADAAKCYGWRTVGGVDNGLVSIARDGR